MKIAGLDPGSQRTGYALIESSGAGIRVLDLGVWELLDKKSAKTELGIRLERLHLCSSEWIRKHNPDVIGFEKAVSFKSVPSALTLSEARGVLRLSMFQNLQSVEKRLIELSPTAVKKASGSSGLGSKEQVFKALCMRFSGLDALANKSELTSDAFDALAIAFTAWLQLRHRSLGTLRHSLEV